MLITSSDIGHPLWELDLMTKYEEVTIRWAIKWWKQHKKDTHARFRESGFTNMHHFYSFRMANEYLEYYLKQYPHLFPVPAHGCQQ